MQFAHSFLFFYYFSTLFDNVFALYEVNLGELPVKC
ncbi:hypothetical protein LAJLEIBI_03326 [[Clostridium] hylemonae DSM 15053]|nr:hypothetical protein LAJLEIBI_03326 [[Clostridium] hylemonae DSM 15053]